MACLNLPADRPPAGAGHRRTSTGAWCAAGPAAGSQATQSPLRASAPHRSGARCGAAFAGRLAAGSAKCLDQALQPRGSGL